MVQIFITYANNDTDELSVNREDFTINDNDLTVFDGEYIAKYVNLATVKTIDFIYEDDED